MVGQISGFLHNAVEVLSGEWMLTKPHRRANGGTIILFRSVFVSGLLYVLALTLRQALDPHISTELDWTALRELLVATMSWLGAFFAGIYAAFYARFSSQWSYLAGLYNQIMSAMCRDDSSKILDSWKAAFMEDADELHLALKPIFATIIYNWSQEEDVRASYVAEVPGGEMRFRSLLAEVERVHEKQQRKWNTPAGAAPRTEQPAATTPYSE